MKKTNNEASSNTLDYINKTLAEVKRTTPGQENFLQAATKILHNLIPLLNRDLKYLDHRIIERIILPERSFIFRVTYMDDQNIPCSHFGYRVGFNSALGPYKGGLRFHPSVNLDIVKFLALEQTFKNALTGLNIGGGKGGSSFDPKGKSEGEIMRFAQAFMNELFKVIGDVVDVPAGDIGVSGREIGYMFGQYKKLTGRFEGAFTGKGLNWGGSIGRTEATGYGLVYFSEAMLGKKGDSLEDKKCVVSGAGNVALHTIEKLYEFGATPLTASDSTGFIHDKEGIDLALLKNIKGAKKGVGEYIKERRGATFTKVNEYKSGTNGVWSVACDAAFPCATQNELNLKDVETLYSNGCRLVAEGANMPCTLEAINFMQEQEEMLFAPAKAANAGGVAVSGLEMSQNAMMQKWSFEKVNRRLHEIMINIFNEVYDTSKEFDDVGNLVLGANIAGFKRVANAMIDQGYI